MALRMVLFPNLSTPLNQFHPRSIGHRFRVRAVIQQETQGGDVGDSVPLVQRRSANWPRNIWDYEFIGSLGIEHDEEKLVDQINELKEEAKGMINDRHIGASEKLEFIDAVQRLGHGYHFENEIKDALGLLIRELHSNDLHLTALLFRLVRQHGFNIQQKVLERFLESDDFEGRFEDEDVVKGMLGLYEASFYGLKGDTILDEAKVITLNHLKSLDPNKMKCFPDNLARKVERALDMPIRWRSNRSEARWFMDIYERDPMMKPNLLRLAKLDFNLAQSHHRTEAAQLLEWSSELGIERFEVLRDRPMENYLWGNIMAFEPRWGDFRVMTSMVAFLVTIIDDVYDIFGTMEELELLTEFIHRWDINDIDKLPPVIKATYLALYNTTNDIARRVMRDRGVDVLPYFKIMWGRHCKGYLQEAKWYDGGCKPTFAEYIDNGTNTCGGFVMLFTYFLGMANELSNDALDFACNIPSIVYNSSLIVRLTNDLTTAPYELARGDNFKAVECYENEHGVSREEAKEAIWTMVDEAWKAMNQEELVELEYPSFVTKDFLHACVGFARASHFIYKYGDGHGLSDKETEDYLMDLVVQPVSI